MYGEVIWTSGKRIVAIFISQHNIIRREVGYRIIKWTLLMELSPDNPGGWVAGMGTVEVIKLKKQKEVKKQKLLLFLRCG